MNSKIPPLLYMYIKTKIEYYTQTINTNSYKRNFKCQSSNQASIDHHPNDNDTLRGCK